MASRGDNGDVSKRADDKTAAAPSSSQYPQNTRVIQLMKRPRTVVNHSYVDYSLVPFEIEQNKLPTSIESMNFHQKMHAILGDVDSKHACTWMRHGRSFRIIDPVQFEKLICPKYFGHSRYSSFLHQIGRHGYKALSGSAHRGVFYSQVNIVDETCSVQIKNRHFSQNGKRAAFHHFKSSS